MMKLVLVKRVFIKFQMKPVVQVSIIILNHIYIYMIFPFLYIQNAPYDAIPVIMEIDAGNVVQIEIPGIIVNAISVFMKIRTQIAKVIIVFIKKNKS